MKGNAAFGEGGYDERLGSCSSRFTSRVHSACHVLRPIQPKSCVCLPEMAAGVPCPTPHLQHAAAKGVHFAPPLRRHFHLEPSSTQNQELTFPNTFKCFNTLRIVSTGHSAALVFSLSQVPPADFALHLACTRLAADLAF